MLYNSLSIKELRARVGPAALTRWAWATYAGDPIKTMPAMMATPARTMAMNAVSVMRTSLIASICFMRLKS